MRNKPLIAILLLGLFLRIYLAKELFLYSHDQDLLGWFIKDVATGDWRLIGQETSQIGVFIGPLFYYLMVPVYLLFQMDPIGGVYAVAAISVVTVWSFYWVFEKIFNREAGYTAALIYATSFAIVLTDREVVPTQPVMLWSIWYLYAVHLIYKDRQIGFVYLGVLIGLVWHLNLGLVLLMPVALAAFLFSKRKIEIKYFLTGGLAAAVLLLPLFAFELRHGFSQTNAVLSSFSGEGTQVAGGVAKLDRVMQLVFKNATRLIWGEQFRISSSAAFLLLFVSLIYGYYKKMIEKRFLVLLLSWIAIFIGFFSYNSIVVSEYYLNGMNVVWIYSLVVLLVFVLGKSKMLLYGALGLFVAVNVYRFFSIDINRSGYVERRQVVSFIKEDALRRDYPCVAVSYITDPGLDLGYRYLFFVEGMHVNRPMGGAPVYTIVFPHSLVDRIDESFGALGLIRPDYGRYSKEQIAESCAGENENETYGLFGYTK